MAGPAPEGNAAGRYGWLLALLPVLYVLSTGPAMYLFKAMGQPDALEDIFEVVYYPIEWLWDHSQIAQALLEAYLDLFR